MEKVLLAQLQSFLSENSINEVFQSGFKALHSTESALLRVLNDIFLTTDSGEPMALVLLDLIQFKFICIALFTIQSLQSALQEIKFLQYIYTL